PPAPHPPAPQGPGAKALVLRGVFASFPVWSLGLLGWVPSLRFALLRRRALDWAVLGITLALTVAEILAIALVPDTDSDAGALAGLFTIAWITGATVHGVMGDRFPRRPPAPLPPSPYLAHPAAAPAAAFPPAVYPMPTAPAAAPPHPGPSPRMRQVASELDELGELLRRQEGR
ncbi:hypothetical protein RM780_27345, partial [Streptomyces sp. DSM 44917]